MKFDWKTESKEKYFKKAERKIEESGFADLIHIDKGAFSTIKNDFVKVHFKPIARKGNTKRWWSAKKEIENIQEQGPIKRGYFGKKEKTMLIHGYMLIEMEERDK